MFRLRIRTTWNVEPSWLKNGVSGNLPDLPCRRGNLNRKSDFPGRASPETLAHLLDSRQYPRAIHYLLLGRFLRPFKEHDDMDRPIGSGEPDGAPRIQPVRGTTISRPGRLYFHPVFRGFPCAA